MKNRRILKGFCVLGLLLGLNACTPENQDLKLGTLVEAQFTVTNISTDDMHNTYLLTCTSEGGFEYIWDLGNGNSFNGDATDTAYYSDKGTYTITLLLVSAGGQSQVQQELTVEEDASTGLNVVVGGEMDDENAWTFQSTGSSLTDYTFSDGAVVFTNEGTAQTNIAMWQPVELNAATSYQFSAAVSGAGMTNSWLEVLILDEEPVEGTDYADERITGLHTWTGCGVDAFDGKLPDLSCIGDGTIDITTGGTYYLFIKVGSWDGNLGDGGVLLDDVKLVGLDTEPLVEGDNYLQGSDMEDEDAWTFQSTGSTVTDFAFEEGKVIFTNGDNVQTNLAMWQAVDLDAGTTYQFSASVAGSGMTNSWLEIVWLEEEPVEGTDYTETTIAGLNTWDGCGGDAFDGKLPALSCLGDGLVEVTSTGTYYLFIKVGSWDGTLGTDGVSVDDVQLRILN